MEILGAIGYAGAPSGAASITGTPVKVHEEAADGGAPRTAGAETAGSGILRGIGKERGRGERGTGKESAIARERGTEAGTGHAASVLVLETTIGGIPDLVGTAVAITDSRALCSTFPLGFLAKIGLQAAAVTKGILRMNLGRCTELYWWDSCV